MTQQAKQVLGKLYVNPENPCDVLGPNGIVARCASRNPAYDGPEFSAYARLFAAAPELLAALKAAATRLESGNEVDQACARHCRMAIAKAEQQP